VTASPDGTLPADTGVIGRPETEILFGGQDLFGEMRSGLRLTGGFWWTPAQWDGIEASYFELDCAPRKGRFDSLVEPRIARPYFDENDHKEASRLVAYPHILGPIEDDPSKDPSRITVYITSTFSGAELLLRQSIGDGLLRRVYLVGGYRFARLTDRLETRETLHSLDPRSGYAAGTYIERSDQFEAISSFHGGEAGLVARWWRNRLLLQVQGKVALGATMTDVWIDGRTTTYPGAPPNEDEGNRYLGGVLALPTNMGRHQSSSLAAIEELGVSLDYAVTCNLRASLGYNFIYWSRVARATDQIDRNINPTQFPPGTLAGTARPEFALKTTDFWAQGLSLGVEYQF
jgi:hypothetical protein